MYPPGSKKQGAIHHMPVEILHLILKEVAAESKSSNKKVSKKSTTRAMFPFNVASVCSLWLQIAKSNKSWWKDIYLDISDDPTPFLDVFDLFADPDVPLKIKVFSSHEEDYSDTDGWGKRRDVENARAKAIFKHLRPAITRYSDITFDLVFQSSLPTAAEILTIRRLPHLERLSLCCLVYDLDEDDEITLTLDGVHFPVDIVVPSLRRLHLTGHALMQLFRLGEFCVVGFKFQLTEKVEVRITGFTFHAPDVGSHNATRSVGTFVDLLSYTEYNFKNLYLEDFSAIYKPPPIMHKFLIHPQELYFNNVSHSFLVAFFSYAELPTGIRQLTFRDSSIPENISTHHPRTLKVHKLTLIDIPFQAVDSNSNQLDSLHLAMTGFQVISAVFVNCAGFNDNLLAFLTKEQYWTRHMLHLRIENCSSFTLKALFSFISVRAKAHLTEDSDVLHSVRVFGDAPALSIHDVAWLLDSANTDDCHVEWEVNGEPSGRCITSFKNY